MARRGRRRGRGAGRERKARGAGEVSGATRRSTGIGGIDRSVREEVAAAVILIRQPVVENRSALDGSLASRAAQEHALEQTRNIAIGMSVEIASAAMSALVDVCHRL